MSYSTVSKGVLLGSVLSVSLLVHSAAMAVSTTPDENTVTSTVQNDGWARVEGWVDVKPRYHHGTKKIRLGKMPDWSEPYHNGLDYSNYFQGSRGIVKGARWVKCGYKSTQDTPSRVGGRFTKLDMDSATVGYGFKEGTCVRVWPKSKSGSHNVYYYVDFHWHGTW